MNVLQAAKIRIRNVFANGCKIYLSFSSGKDSLCMANLVYEMILSGELDPKQLTVTFIDEEGLYPSMVDAAHRWRRNFLSVGAKFLWFCLPFKQVCVIDHLSASESWITWEPGKEDVWMRTPPDFAIRYSPYLHHPGEMNYQTFCEKAFRDGIQLVGLRTAESLTRFKCIANTKMERITKGGKFYPIYDWADSDVWLYIKERNLEFPEIYMRLYEAGVHKNALRLCAFFGDTSTQGLRWVAETDNDLWERIQRREPNAYLVLLYWDSEMFRRSTRKRRELEADTEQKDYKALCKDLLFLHPERYTIAKDTLSHIDHWRGLFIKTYGIAAQSTTRPCMRGCCMEIPRCVSCASSGPPSTTTTTPASRRSRTMENIDVFAPLASLQWVDRNTIHANDYNPNKVSEENLKLLVQSILTNGWTLPIVVRPDGTIIDGFHRWTVSGREPLLSLLGGKVPVVVVDHHGDESADVYGTITHNRARGTHLLDPMKAIVKKLMDEGKTVDEIGKQLGMKPEEIFRLSGFTKDEFLNMMTKDHPTYSKAKVIRSI